MTVGSKILIGFPNVLLMKSHPACVFVGKASFNRDLLMYDTANGGMVQDGSIEMVTMINAALLVYVIDVQMDLRRACHEGKKD